MPSLSKEAALVHEALVARGLETPLRPPVHEMDNETRKSLIAGHMTEIMQLLNLDLADDSLMETPHRIAKMYVDEIFSGLDYANFPKITLIENKFNICTRFNISINRNKELTQHLNFIKQRTQFIIISVKTIF